MRTLRAIGLVIVLWRAAAAWAHPSPQSEVLLVAEPGRVRAEVTLPLDELQLAMPVPLLNARGTRVLASDAGMKAYLGAHIRPVTQDGRAWIVKVLDLQWRLRERPADLRATVRLTPPAGAPSDELVFGFDAIAHQVPNHLTLVAVRTEREGAAPAVLGTLHYGQRSLRVKLADGAWWRGMADLFKLGAMHIAEGSDHLLFLFALLLPAPLLVREGHWDRFGGGRQLAVRLLGIVTAFTVGHSLTLLLGALGAVALPAQPVEIAIAFSILVSAVHAWRPLFAGKEALIAGSFGLVHGLAFASAIGELQLRGARLAAGLLAFNLGIEAFQMAAVAALVPILVALARTRHYHRVRKLAAVGAGMAALFWMAQRI